MCKRRAGWFRYTQIQGRFIEEFKGELHSSALEEDRNDGEAVSDPRSEEENRVRQEEEEGGRKLVRKEQALPTTEGTA
jgi:hypothetical protein